ncbi:Cobyrinic acid a,c-diamide synthase (fragment) [Hyella patelloides LEGE 07179]|uniref:Cobyrinic acid a,c-diamide synthase n=1 Tax=Hyella patelloides LEGE 07179 TaxID=945734 RepID=A0A563VVJ2_9CYAN
MATTIAITSLSGGQGKSTLSLFLARRLSKEAPTLAIDTDPQHNLTTYLGVELQKNQPTLLEFLQDTVDFEDAVYPTSVQDAGDLFLIPADDGFDSANDYLSSSSIGAMLLSRRLESMSDIFKFCIIDSPPQRSQISKTVIGAADFLVIPAEANAKGFGSVIRTRFLD